MSLETFSTEELESEINRRKGKIKVTCPICDGEGKEGYYNMRVAAGEEDGIRDCQTCGGIGWFKARRHE